MATSKCPTPLLRYLGGEVTAAEYHSWLELTEGEDDADRRQQTLTTIAVQEALADAARKRGAAGQPPLRWALLNLESHLLERALRLEMASEISIDEQQIATWLEQHRERMDRPRRVRLENIFKQVDDAADLNASRLAMAAIRQRLLAGEDWAAVALAESDSQTRFRRGSIGWVKPGILDPAIESVAFALASGEISEVIETEAGLTLLRCERVEEEQRPDVLEKRQRAQRNLRRQQRQEQWQALKSELLASVSFDREKARLLSTPKDSVIVRAEGGWSLSLAAIEGLLRFRGVHRPLADLPEERVGELLETLATRLQAADRARSMGLDQDRELQAKLHWQRLLALAADELGHRVEVRFESLSEEQIRAYFEDHREDFQWLESFRLEAISMRAEAAELRQRYAFAQRLEGDLRASRISFAEAARRYSQLPSASRGGALGWLDRQQVAALGPFLFKSVTRLAAGELGRLVQQPDSLPRDGHTLWLVRLLEKRAARPMSFAEARRHAENALGNEQTREIQRQLEEELVTELELRWIGEPSP